MAPYNTNRAVETFRPLSPLSYALRMRQDYDMQSTDDACVGDGCNDGSSEPDMISAQLGPTATIPITLEKSHVPTMAAWSAQSSAPTAITLHGDAKIDLAGGRLSTSAIVGIALAFISVLLGLGAMALTRSRWYRLRKEEWEVCSAVAKGPVAAENYEPKSILQKPAEAGTVGADQDNYVVADDEETTTEETDTTEEIESRETSCSSEETARMSWGSSMTSVNIDSDCSEDEEGVFQVHRARTQSVEIKRAVLISIPAK